LSVQIAGFVLFFFITLSLLRAHVSMDDWIKLSISGGVGVAGGILMVLIWRIGFFVVGFMAGALLGCCAVAFTPLSSVILNNAGSATLWVTLAVIIGLGILVGVFAVIFAKHIIIFSSAIDGAIMMGMGVDNLANLRLFGFLEAIVAGVIPKDLVGTNFNTDWPVWLLLFGIIVFAVAGIVVQYRITARDFDHSKEKGKGEEEFPLLIQNH